MINRAKASSKGYQKKWESNGYWYKEDEIGGEAFIEELVSIFLSLQSSLSFVAYKRVGDGSISCSKSFKQPGEEFYTLYRICKFMTYTDKQLEEVWRSSTKDQIRFVVDLLHKFQLDFTYIFRVLQYAFELDALILNEDRHWNNIGLLLHSDWIEIMVGFDFGGSLGLFHKDIPISLIPRKAKARTVSTSFSKQLVALYEVAKEYGVVLPKWEWMITDTFLDFLKGHENRFSLLFLKQLEKEVQRNQV